MLINEDIQFDECMLLFWEDQNAPLCIISFSESFVKNVTLKFWNKNLS